MPNSQTKTRISGRLVIIEFDSVYIVIEAKRIRSNSFQEKQLAREFVLATKENIDKTPLLLLILSHEPPVLVKGEGRQTIEHSIITHLEEVMFNTEDHPLSVEEIKELINEHTAWITWDKIEEIIITCLHESKHSYQWNQITKLKQGIKLNEKI